jgi:methylenetetrahydrofolate reductase (NADPH)
VIGACYPESDELDYVRAKVDAGVTALITQMFFDNRDYLRFVERLRGAGIDVPVLPGILPIASAAQVERIATLCGATVPAGLRRELEARAHDPAAAAQLGIAYATAQCAELLDAGVPGLHFFTFNRAPATLSIVGALRAQGRWAPAVAAR